MTTLTEHYFHTQALSGLQNHTNILSTQWSQLAEPEPARPKEAENVTTTQRDDVCKTRAVGTAASPAPQTRAIPKTAHSAREHPRPLQRTAGSSLTMDIKKIISLFYC